MRWTALIWPLFAIVVLTSALPGASPSQLAWKDEVDVVIIANPQVPDTTLSPGELEKIFLGKSTKWSDGKKIRFVNLKGGDVHETFTKEYTGKTAIQYTNYWRKRVFTGKGRMPTTFGTEEKLLDYVAQTPGAIGYVSKQTATDPKIVDDPKTGDPRVATITTGERGALSE